MLSKSFPGEFVCYSHISRYTASETPIIWYIKTSYTFKPTIIDVTGTSPDGDEHPKVIRVLQFREATHVPDMSVHCT